MSKRARWVVAGVVAVLLVAIAATSKAATLAEAQAGTSKTQAFEQQLLAQKSLVEAAEADLEAAQLRVKETTLRSPVDGYVSARQLDVGALASVGSRILTVQSGGQVWVVAAMPQEVYNRVEVGHPCNITVDGVRDRTFSAKVFAKDPAVDAASRQFNVRVTFDNQDKLVRPGMFARLHIKVGEPNPTLAVPNSALVDREAGTRKAFVFVLDGKKVKRTEVTLGLSNQTYTRLRGGLEEGQVVVVQTATPLRNDQEVNPKEGPPPTPSPEPTR